MAKTKTLISCAVTAQLMCKLLVFSCKGSYFYLVDAERMDALLGKSLLFMRVVIIFFLESVICIIVFQDTRVTIYVHIIYKSVNLSLITLNEIEETVYKFCV